MTYFRTCVKVWKSLDSKPTELQKPSTARCKGDRGKDGGWMSHQPHLHVRETFLSLLQQGSEFWHNLKMSETVEA
jgi:hypothetical protein